MKLINLCTLQVRLGKCNLNLKSQGNFAISLEIGKHTSSLSKVKTIKNNTINFNTTLRINIEKQLVDQANNPKCRILLHLLRQNRQRTVIGVATIDLNQENSKQFKYHQFGQCADCQAEVEAAVAVSNAFQLGTKSQIGYFYGSSSPIRDQNGLSQSQGDSRVADSIDKQQLNFMKQSKALSNIDFVPRHRAQRPSLRIKVKRDNNIFALRKPQPSNLKDSSPNQIITHYQAEINTLERQIKERDDWAIGMKDLIQQLEAENQLLKEIRIQELAENEIENLEQGIQFVSKIVHTKFQMSRSMLHASPGSEKGNQSSQGNSEKQNAETAQTQQLSERRSLKQTKSFKDLPIASQDCREFRNVPCVESRQEIQNALTILTGETKPVNFLQQNTKIVELEEELFKLRQQKHQLQSVTQDVLTELKRQKQLKDKYQFQVKQMQLDDEKLRQYLDQIKSQNCKLKDEIQKYQKIATTEEYDRLIQQNAKLKDKTKELQRQLKESLKAIEVFKNDALSARQQIIVKEEEISNFKSKYGELGSMTDVLLRNVQKNLREDSRNLQHSVRLAKQQISISQCNADNNMQLGKFASSTLNSQTSIHSLYSHLLQSSIEQRKKLQNSLSQIIQSRSKTVSNIGKEESIKRLQSKINKMFVQLVKNRADIKNMKELQKLKGEISKQIEQILMGV